MYSPCPDAALVANLEQSTQVRDLDNIIMSDPRNMLKMVSPICKRWWRSQKDISLMEFEIIYIMVSNHSYIMTAEK